MQRAARLTITILILASTLACATVIAPVPEGPHLAMQTIVETLNITTGASFVQVVSADISGRVVQEYPQSYGSVSSFTPIRSDGQGMLYVANARLNADWTTTWWSDPEGCVGDESSPFYAQDGVIYTGLCIVTITTLQAFNYSFLLDGTQVYTGGTDKMQPGEVLHPGDTRTSADGRFHLTYQTDGNLVLYDDELPVWSSSTAGTTAGQTVMQADGNLVVYDGSANAVWSSSTQGNDGAYLAVLSNGMAVVYHPNGSVLWSTPTGCLVNCPFAPGGPSVSLTLAPGEIGELSFTGAAGQRVSATMTLTSGGSFSCYWYLKILKPDDSVLGSTNACGGTMKYLDVVTLPVSGQYTLLVDPTGNGTGTVEITLHDVIDVTGSLIIGEAVSAPLTTPGQRGVWNFTGSSSQVVSASVSTSTMGTCSLIYHSFKVLDSTGTPLATTSNLCAGGIVGPVVLPAAGTYTLIVDPHLSYTGQIVFTLNDVVDLTGSLLFGEAVSAPLTTPGQRGVWNFTGSPDQVVSASISTSTMGNCSLTYHSFKVLDSTGTPLATTSNLCAGGIVGPVVLPAADTYTLIVDPHLSYTGQIVLTLNEVVDVTGAITLNGTSVSASLTTPGQRGVWTFEANAGIQVRALIDSSSVTICPLTYHKLNILKPDGSLLTSKSGLCAGGVAGPATLPMSGTYTLIADPSAAYTGGVTVRIVSP